MPATGQDSPCPFWDPLPPPPPPLRTVAVRACRAPLTFTLEQEEVCAVAEGRAEVRAVLHQVTGQALPVEGAHRAGAGGAETGGREPRRRGPGAADKAQTPARLQGSPRAAESLTLRLRLRTGPLHRLPGNARERAGTRRNAPERSALRPASCPAGAPAPKSSARSTSALRGRALRCALAHPRVHQARAPPLWGGHSARPQALWRGGDGFPDLWIVSEGLALAHGTSGTPGTPETRAELNSGRSERDLPQSRTESWCSSLGGAGGAGTPGPRSASTISRQEGLKCVSKNEDTEESLHTPGGSSCLSILQGKGQL